MDKHGHENTRLVGVDASMFLQERDVPRDLDLGHGERDQHLSHNLGHRERGRGLGLHFRRDLSRERDVRIQAFFVTLVESIMYAIDTVLS